jgi:hypothetical protein
MLDGIPSETTTDARTSPTRDVPVRLFLAAVVAISLALRVALILGGGQNFWPDEIRYEWSRRAVAALRQGDWAAAGRALDQPEHVLYPVLALAPAAIETAAGPDARIPAVFFALFSVACIPILYGIMRRLGETQESSCLAALLLALSATQLYYSRHILPYDTALALLLAGLYAGLRRPDRIRDSLLCGALCAAGFLTYNGYWLLAAFAALAHAVAAPSSLRASLRRVVALGAGVALPLAAIAAADAAAGGGYLPRWWKFAGTVTQGSYSEGWWIPFAYLWHADHLLTVLWAASFVYAVHAIAVRRSRDRALVLGVAGILFVYGGLVLVSVGLERFVVYGRHVRQLIPFASMLGGSALGRLAASGMRLRRLAALVLAAACLQAAIDFGPPLRQVFPEEFRRMAARVPNPDGAPRLVLYARHIYPTPAPPPPNAFDELLARPHPLQYLPYQYEGYTPSERHALRAVDIRMRLVRAKPAPAAPAR